MSGPPKTAIGTGASQGIGARESSKDLSIRGFDPPVTLKAGDVLFIPAGTIHSARNVGTGRAAELATYIVEKGKPLVVLAK
jgi:hypothetical protein